MPLSRSAIFYDIWKNVNSLQSVGNLLQSVEVWPIPYEKFGGTKKFRVKMAIFASCESNLAMSKDFGQCYMNNFNNSKNLKGERLQTVKN